MSNFQVCDAEKKSNNSKTIVIVNANSNLKNTDIKFFQEISAFEPSENVALQFSMKSLNNNAYSNCFYCGHHLRSQQFTALFNHKRCDNPLESFKYDLTLTFSNKIHEVYPDYDYEILVQALISKEHLNHHYHLPFFKDSSTRTSDKVQFSNEFTFQYKGNIYIEHICCTITRICSKKQIDTRLDCVPQINFEESQLFGDVSIVTGDKTFFAHKYMLALKSDVFKAMFCHNLTENQDGLVKISDCSSEVMEEFLQYIYSNKVKNSSALSMDLYRLAHKYQVHCLKQKCLEHLLFDLNYENALAIFDFVSFYDMPDLMEKLTNFMNTHEDQMVKLSDYRKLICLNLATETVVNTLKLCYKYRLDDVTLKAFEFIKNNSTVANDKKFLELFHSNPEIMEDLFVYEKLGEFKAFRAKEMDMDSVTTSSPSVSDDES